ncbi:hypothetical protein GGR56DRAFT_652355 [Xylariaceae sp. FL0804]|nr:hypothetical protein GGR56DRAFT_652355 [Xylariaceae sp. FL0804]
MNPAPRIGSLRVYRYDDNTGRVYNFSPDDPAFQCVAAIVGFGVDLLTSPAGSSALCRTGRKNLSKLHSTRPGLTFRMVDEMENYVNDFLYQTHESFPAVIVRKLRSETARTQKATWNIGPNLHFEPKRAGLIELNSLFISRVVHLCQRSMLNPEAHARFRTLIARLGITMAHELCHLFTNYLTLCFDVHTPPGVTYGPYGAANVGESGRRWEGYAFGGFIDMRNGRDGEKIAARDRQCNVAYVLSQTKVDELLARDFRELEVADMDTRNPPRRMTNDKWLSKYETSNESTGNARDLPVQLREQLMVGRGACYDVYGANLRDFVFNPSIPVMYRESVILVMR